MNELLVSHTDLYSKEYTRDEVARDLNISTRTLIAYLAFGADYIPDLFCFLNEQGKLNRTKLESHHIEYLREIKDLLKQFSRPRVVLILQRKYQSESLA